MYEFLLDVATLLLIPGSLMLLYKVYKDRKVLRGYSLVGSALTFLATMIYTSYFFLNKVYLSTIFAIPTDLYWLLVIIFLLWMRSKD